MASRPADRRSVALLIDADNASPDGFEDVLAILAELGPVNLRRAYGNWAKPALKGWAALTHRHAIVPVQQFDVVKGKSATDMLMTIEAMDLLLSGRVDAFGLMSSDSDFMPLAMRLRQDVEVYGFGTGKTPESFRQACNRFILTDELGKPEPALVAEDEDGPDGDDTLFKALAAAWKASKRDEKGFARLGDVGNRLNAGSSFDVRSTGYSSLSELVQKNRQFVSERRDDGLWVKRVR